MHNASNKDAHLFDMAASKIGNKNIYASSMPPVTKGNESFIGGDRHGVLFRDVTEILLGALLTEKELKNPFKSIITMRYQKWNTKARTN